MREGVGTFVVPQPSVVSEVWLQCLLSGGECCFLISACSYLERSWHRVAAVVLHLERGFGCALLLSM